MIKGILFDMDGVLVNSEKYYMEGTVKWMERVGYTGGIKNAISIIGKTMKETYKIEAELTGLSEQECQELNDRYFYEEDVIDYAMYQFPDVGETLKQLKEKGFKIAVCSMTDYKDVQRCVKEIKLENYVDLVLGGEHVKNSKPAPDIYLKAMNELKLNYKEVLIVEDSPYGILAGKAAGSITVARKDKQFGIDQSNADIIIDDFHELFDVIRRQNERDNQD